MKVYIDEKRSDLAKKALKEKEATLLELGLYSLERVYSEEGRRSWLKHTNPNSLINLYLTSYC